MFLFMSVLVHSYLKECLAGVPLLSDLLELLKDFLDLVLNFKCLLGYNFMNVKEFRFVCQSLEVFV